MLDQQGRTIEYLRLSVTDRCNYHCTYCMPGGTCGGERDLLSFDELVEIARAAVACGVRKIRLTGGEPLVRPELTDLCCALRALPGVEELTITTNGSLLPQLAGELKAAGVDRLNVSLDTLDADKFAALTGCGRPEQTLAGLEAADAAGFRDTKINTVLMGGVNDDEIMNLIELTRDQPYCLRFIELMPIGACAHWPAERFVKADAVLRAVPALRPIGASGVAELYQIPGWAGTVGLIRPMSHRFCAECDRVRVTADGVLRPCLHAPDGLPLRGLRGDALVEAIQQGIARKPVCHHLAVDCPSESGRAMYEIGG